MIDRCFNKNRKAYSKYGGRGITVCERWMSFDNFRIDMGEKPKGLTIERIDNDKNYEPSNCKWGTMQEQNMNKRHYSPPNKKSGLPLGVNHHGNKFTAKVRIKGQDHYLGRFSTINEASKAVEECFDKYAPNLKPIKLG